MLPQTLQLPAAAILIVGGLVACFAGYRLFRIVLGIYGFILGALFASSLVAPSDTTAMMIAAVVGGVAGAAILFAAYFVGVVIVGAGLGAMVAQAVWSSAGRDPSPLIVIFCAVAGGAGAWFAQRYVLIAATAFGGAWTALYGVMAVMAAQGRRAVPSSSVWLAYPLAPAPGQRWFLLAWIALGIVGTVVQMRGPAKRKGSGRRR